MWKFILEVLENVGLFKDGCINFKTNWTGAKSKPNFIYLITCQSIFRGFFQYAVGEVFINNFKSNKR